MGNLKTKQKIDFDGEVDFNHFKLLRSVGKGSFGKVCIVMKKDTKKLYALKYTNKRICIECDAVNNVLNERTILNRLTHPLIVNLWFSFQDSDDLFMVVDLMLGGDLHYHIQRTGVFTESRVCQYAAEIGCALEFLHGQNIIHRDIKPDNILMDANGHVRLADFNVAAFIPSKGSLRTIVGTRPYMAPEMVMGKGYTVAADWWSLGASLYEMLVGKSPFHATTSECIMEYIKTKTVKFPPGISKTSIKFLMQLLERDPTKRLGTPYNMELYKSHPYTNSINCDWDQIANYCIEPEFIPNKDQVNCDAMYELEEMMLADNPLHKKKPSKTNTASRKQLPPEPEGFAAEMQKLETLFLTFDRDKLQAMKSEESTDTTDVITLHKVNDVNRSRNAEYLIPDELDVSSYRVK